MTTDKATARILALMAGNAFALNLSYEDFISRYNSSSGLSSGDVHTTLITSSVSFAGIVAGYVALRSSRPENATNAENVSAGSIAVLMVVWLVAVLGATHGR